MLIVDDCGDAVEMYCQYFELEGYETIMAANGEEALTRAKEFRPDVILMDLSMPVVDGYSATQTLKEDPETRHIPVVALSGHVMAQHRARAKEAGCDTLVPKPVQPQRLGAKIRSLLQASSSTARRESAD